MQTSVSHLVRRNIALVVSRPFIADIRDTVNYKEVMKQYQLGPNGGIVTALNLFSTKFGQVVDLVECAGSKHKYCIIDTPGRCKAPRSRKPSTDRFHSICNL